MGHSVEIIRVENCCYTPGIIVITLPSKFGSEIKWNINDFETIESKDFEKFLKYMANMNAKNYCEIKSSPKEFSCRTWKISIVNNTFRLRFNILDDEISMIDMGIQFEYKIPEMIPIMKDIIRGIKKIEKWKEYEDELDSDEDGCDGECDEDEEYEEEEYEEEEEEEYEEEDCDSEKIGSNKILNLFRFFKNIVKSKFK